MAKRFLPLIMSARALSTGAAAPEFAVTSHKGERVSSDSLSKYLLWFYPKADTSG